MHIHYFVLHKLAKKLEEQFLGATLVECFSQQKDELVIGFATENAQCYLRVQCGSPLQVIWPVEDYKMARRNVASVFSEAIGKDIVGFSVVEWERILRIELEEGLFLLLKMHGNRSNVLFCKGASVLEIFRNNIPGDMEIPAGGREPAWDGLEDDLPTKENLKNLSPVFSKGFPECLEEKYENAKELKQALEALISKSGDDHFFLVRNGASVSFRSFDCGREGMQVKGVSEALDLFCRIYLQLTQYKRLYSDVASVLGKEKKKAEKQLAGYEKNLLQLRNQRPPEEIANLLMANLHALRHGMEECELFDFYKNEQTVIRLKKDRTPQQNAEYYYQKQKKQRSKEQYLEELADKARDRLSESLSALEPMDKLPDPESICISSRGIDFGPVKELRMLAKGLGIVGEKKQDKGSTHPFLELTKDGYRIFVGRNARNNDELTLKFASKNDLWLHAKDVSGSHVVIRVQPGKKVPIGVQEYAASVAAFYSKRKHDTLVPVIITPKKYVRKRKGDPPGAVVVEREEVILIEPVKPKDFR